MARAGSVGTPNASGRMQINWLGPRDEFISSSGKTFTVSDKVQEFATHVIPPPGITAGLLYVTPHAPEDIVRYTEMRVLGENQN